MMGRSDLLFYGNDLSTVLRANLEDGKDDVEKITEEQVNVIRHEGRSFEATPGTFVKHDEEELRDIILAHLNGHYEGDVVRRFAQPLGIQLPEWEGRIIETEKGVVRLLPVTERAKQLFGEETAHAFAERFEQSPQGNIQMSLFQQREEALPPQIKGRDRKGTKKTHLGLSEEAAKKHKGATTLDRVHASMLLQSSGQTNALRALLKAEQDRGPDFLRLANSLSALYPKGSNEKRLLDAMLLAVPR
jgi:hypothetical protein